MRCFIVLYDLYHILAVPVIIFLTNFKIDKFAMNFIEQPHMEGKEGVDALFQFATEGILVTNDKGEITRINPSAERLFGYGKGELIGKKIELLVPKRLTEKHIGYRDK